MADRLILLPGWGLGTAPLQPLTEALRGLDPHLQVQVEPLPVVNSNDPADWLDALDASVPQDAWLGGWSLGGMLATALAARRGGRCRGLLTLASNACFVARDAWPQAMPADTFVGFYQGCEANVDATLKRFAMLCAQGSLDARGLSRQLQAHLLLSDEASALAGLRVLAAIDNRAALRGFAGPQQHLLAEQDALVPAAVSDALVALLPTGEVDVLEGCGHALVLEQADTLAALMLDFIREASDV
ncbi:pimeloyl-[acyl-carrier protein] methyl ester esterase [Pseudomonas cuatrocienegasensis]|uniref:Pimeloyl-[acyl-carrier protein] methyl ester esterase n=1 Tax=Pseudomonas cuatrocienegasensis TaxID=543360 RepID=A0ABY1BIV9_9PSED|nr:MULTISPECIES: alpha/beta fold hydrolase [Pseudomonas]OEC34618.1 transporter [Pseudomonas sp. 21C1]SEQ96442.1 pimeloyl-[acyl-carrier protein] methyl ester esterase [Pseudomonas cuatrocienegasensis]